MAIPSMPSGVYIQTQNLQNLISWDIASGATSYSIQRSTDGVNFSTLDTSSTNSYLDTAISSGNLYYYQVASVNSDGTSPYAVPSNGNATCVAPAPNAEMSLLSLRFAAQQKADMVNSQFVTIPEWNQFIDLAMYELYDLLITVYEDYNVAPPIQWTANGTDYLYPLPNGILTFTNRVTNDASYVAPPLYKLLGIDLGLGSSNNGYVTVNKFNFIDRNRFVYPNTASTIYGVFNLQYRMMGSNIMFIPTPSGNQVLSMWYIPRLPPLLKDTDVTTLGISGWLQYVIIRAAKYALDKEETPNELASELLFLKQRIEESASNRDAGLPDKVSDIRSTGYYWGAGSIFGFNGTTAGF